MRVRRERGLNDCFQLSLEDAFFYWPVQTMIDTQVRSKPAERLLGHSHRCNQQNGSESLVF